MIITIVGLVLLGLILLIAMYVGFKSVATLGDKLKDIADGYRIIPVEQYTQHDK